MMMALNDLPRATKNRFSLVNSASSATMFTTKAPITDKASNAATKVGSPVLMRRSVSSPHPLPFFQSRYKYMQEPRQTNPKKPKMTLEKIGAVHYEATLRPSPGSGGRVNQ